MYETRGGGLRLPKQGSSQSARSQMIFQPTIDMSTDAWSLILDMQNLLPAHRFVRANTWLLFRALRLGVVCEIEQQTDEILGISLGFCHNENIVCVNMGFGSEQSIEAGIMVRKLLKVTGKEWCIPITVKKLVKMSPVVTKKTESVVMNFWIWLMRCPGKIFKVLTSSYWLYLINCHEGDVLKKKLTSL